MIRTIFALFAILLLAKATPSLAAQAQAQANDSATTKYDTDKCKFMPDKDEEDDGSWHCAGLGGTEVFLSASDQRMFVSFGPQADKQKAATETFPGFNEAFKGSIEWRFPKGARNRPFATIMRWNVHREDDPGDEATAPVLVVTRLGADGVCHVGYVDAKANPNAVALARKLADETANGFKCQTDKPKVVGNVSPGLNMPKDE